MKKKLISLAVVFAVALNIFILPAFADYEFDDSKGTAITDSINLSLSDARSFCYSYMQYIHHAFIDLDPSSAHYVFSSNHLNDSRNANYQLLLINSSSTSAVWARHYLTMDNVINAYQFSINVQRHGDEYIISMNTYNYGTSLPLDLTDTILATDLTITRDGEQVIEPDKPPQFSATITYDAGSDCVNFYINNLSDDKTFGFACGISGYQDFGLSSVGPGLDYTRSVPLQSIIDWSDDHNDNFDNYLCWLTVYDGIDVAEHQEMYLSTVLSGGNGDDMYDEKLDYLPLPDYSDYVDWTDWPDFPSLTPFPSYPGFDPDHPWESLFHILEWIGQCLLVPFQNLFAILQWVAELIKEFGSKLGHTFLWLKDVFWVLIQNIGIALHNLVVDIRALLMRLFVPRKFIIDTYLNKYFPIIQQTKDFFTNLSVSGSNSISIPVFIGGGGGTMNISAIDSLGSSNCATLYNISTYIIMAFVLFAEINLFSSFAGLFPHSNTGGDIE